jgi:hypothetical protein
MEQSMGMTTRMRIEKTNKYWADSRPMKPTFEQLLAWADDDGRYWLNERAAIYEYDAGMQRELAEAQAAEDFSELR